ncbi:WD40 repeat domain-containing protein [Nostoc sp. CMAA1605]|uniref:WD40 repeat domain-containing protein n=1 Tax=Nostoc sp. CMAA1605 TaxID=2055159 RepID=UPI001F2819D9|nr:WD40 repeat domain-containing protein [Nostoc sp. CMAA1605]MCF4968672.1 WD40 repeat domain-containing protein [Nostoc sp. CMAA1605]
MRDIQAWAFLVGCNQYLDYRTIVAPSFMCESKTSSLLAKAAGGDLTEIGTAYYREIHNSKVGDLTLVFRVIEATSENTGIEGKGVLKDSFGREINLIEGIVLQGLQPGIVVTQENLEEIHQKMIVHYQDFWNTTTSQPAIQSENCRLRTNIVTNIRLRYHLLKEYPVNSNPKKTIENNISNLKHQEKAQLWIGQLFKELGNEITSVAFFKNESYFVIRCDRNVLHQNDLLSQQSVFICNINCQVNYSFQGEYVISKLNHYTPVVVSYDQKYIASAMIETPEQNVVKVWETETQKEIKFYGHLPGFWNRINALAFVPNIPYLISGGKDSTLFIWDLKSNCIINKIKTQNIIFTIAVSQNQGQTIIVVGQNGGMITAWNLEFQDEIYQVRGHKLKVKSLAFSPQDNILASGSEDTTIKLWKSTTGELISTLGYHLDSVNSIVFSPDGQILASGSDDCTIKLWDVYRRKEIAVLTGHTKAVTSVSFSPDGRTLVSGSKDKTIRLWERSSV